LQKKEENIELYDFLYEDKDRMHFYFSQLFEGLLKEVETVEQSKSDSNINVSIGAFKTYAEYNATDEMNKLLKEKKEPLDIIALKLFEKVDLSTLRNFNDAMEGRLFIEYGSFSLISKELIKSVYSFFFETIDKVNSLKLTGSKKRKEIERISKFLGITKDEIEMWSQVIDLLKPFIEKISFESFAVFTTSSEQRLVGIIKEEYLKDSLNSYYLKYGEKSISNVYLIGIKDYKPSKLNYDFDSFLNGFSQIFEGIKQMVIPFEHELFTPIAIFRKIEAR